MMFTAADFKADRQWTAATLSGICCLALLLLRFMAPVSSAWADRISERRQTCLSSGGSAAVTVCMEALRNDPRDELVRLTLGDALLDVRRYDRAVDVFKTGLEMAPGNPEIKSRLARATQLLDEQRYIDAQQHKREQTGTSGNAGKRRIAESRFEIRCTRLKGSLALAACDEGLAQFPGNAVLHRGKADALMGLGRYGEALKRYEDARILAPSDPGVRSGLLKARTQKKVSYEKCFRLKGQTALDACTAALVKGGEDEAKIRRRMAEVYKTLGRTQEAERGHGAVPMPDGDKNQAVAGKPDPSGARSKMRAGPVVKPAVAASPTPAPVALKAPAPAAKEKDQPRNVRAAAGAQDGSPRAAAASGTASEEKASVRASAAPAAQAESAAGGDATHAFSNAPLPSGFTH